MERLLIESAVRAILIALATGLVLWGVRIKEPSARHAAWTSVLLLMMLLPIWTAWGPKAPLQLLSPLEQSGIAPLPSARLTPAPDALEFEQPTTAGAETRRFEWGTVLIAGYLSGASILLLRLAIGTLRTRRLIRNAIREGEYLTSRSCASPITVGWLRPVIILPAYWKQWPSAQLDAVLIHEREHTRRRDPVIQWLALLNRALFWFHPLAWWLERRLTALAEETCDAAVLAGGHNPQQYSEYLLNIARSVMTSTSKSRYLTKTVR